MPSIKRTIALDTEATGLDWAHGVMPWLVSIAHRTDTPPQMWQWSVDPLTRRVDVPQADVDEIRRELDKADEIIAHNFKYDAHMLTNIGIDIPWDKVRDTLQVSHLLASNHPHNLTDTVMEHLGVNIRQFELDMEVAVKACRQSIIKNEWLTHGVDCRHWILAKKGLPNMPSVGGSGDDEDDKPWKADAWVTFALADALQAAGIDLDDAKFPQAWLDTPRAYAEVDPVVTLALWQWAEKEIKSRDLWEVCMDRMLLVREAYDLERNGVTGSQTETIKMIETCSSEADYLAAECVAIAEQFDFELELPEGAGTNDNVKEFMWGSVRLECPKCGTERKQKAWETGKIREPNCKRCAARKGRQVYQKDSRDKPLKHLPKVLVNGPEQIECVVKENPCLNLPFYISEKTHNPSLDKVAMQHYMATIEPGVALDFIERYASISFRKTAMTYLQSYRRYWLPIDDGMFRIHTHGNPTATDTLRWSFKDPNMSNISDREEFSLRKCFGPAPGREWWKMDFKSIERRIPAYESKEPKMIAVFERPNEAPYWGNLYNLTSSVLYPDKYWPLASENGAFRKAYPNLYKRAKFFDLARQYGCGKRKGDLLSGVVGSSDRINDEFPLLTALQRHYLIFAEKFGYVETIPDRETGTTRGYPILAARNEDGRVSPTTPFCYHVSSTAMQCTNRAMIKTGAQIREWNAEGWSGFLTLQVHDELVWDCPRGTEDEPWQTNLWRMDKLKELMESVGNGIGIPTPVSREYCLTNYATGIAL